MKQVGIDTFAQYRMINTLRAGGGGALAFLVKQANLEKNNYDSDLWLYRNGQAAPLTAGGGVKAFWWKGPEEIVFSALRSEADREKAEKGLPLTVLYSISTTRPGEAQEWLRLPHEVADMAFLPDGRFLFTAAYDAAQRAILDEAGDEEKALALLEEQRACRVLTELPFWANGGGFTSGVRSRLYLYAEGRAAAVTDEATDVEHLRLDANGTQACFIATRFEGVAPVANHIQRLSLATMEVTDAGVPAPFRHEAFALLQNGALLAAGSDMARAGLNQNPSFYRLDEAGAHLLYDGGYYSGWSALAGDLKMPGGVRWAAVGDEVYWITTLDDSAHLMRMNAASGEIACLTEEKGDVMELAADGEGLYFTAMRGLGGCELYALAGGEEQRLTELNTHLQQAYAYVQPEELGAVNSEGVRLQGWVLRPEGWRQGACPAVLYIHGGPKAAYGAALFHELQYLAALGYGVLYCNPTGSDGRGDEFADLRGRYGLIDYEDLMAFTDAALEAHSWIDGARLGVAGGSYGGFMVNWMIGHTERFAAAVSQRGISNWASMANMSDIGYYFVPDQTGADPWNDMDALWEQSPLKYADKAVTPTLFIHSEEDYRCPAAEGLQMYTALKTAGVPTRMCLFPGENHELSRSGKPKARIRRLREIAAWFETHLKNPE